MLDMPLNPTKPNYIYLIYMYEKDLALNNQETLVCYKTQSNRILSEIGFAYGRDLVNITPYFTLAFINIILSR